MPRQVTSTFGEVSLNCYDMIFVGLAKDSVSRKELLECWQEILKQKLVLACFRENSDDLVGLNMLQVKIQDEEDSYEATVSDFRVNNEHWK